MPRLRPLQSARGRSPAAAALLLVAAALALAAVAGCGGNDKETVSAPQTVAEPATARPELPRGWRRIVNRTAGYNLGLPPRWTVQRRKAAWLMRSDDRLAAVAVAADRSAAGQELPLAAYTRQTMDGLRGYRGLRTGRSRPFRHVYEAVSVTGRGMFARTRVRQLLDLFAFRRPGAVTFTMLATRNATTLPQLHKREIVRMARTLRGQEPE